MEPEGELDIMNRGNFEILIDKFNEVTDLNWPWIRTTQ